MPKEKVTLTLDAERLAELRALLGRGSLSAAIDQALAGHLDHLRHLAAIDEWLAEMEATDGPVSEENRARAAAAFDEWEAALGRTPRAS